MQVQVEVGEHSSVKQLTDTYTYRKSRQQMIWIQIDLKLCLHSRML